MPIWIGVPLACRNRVAAYRIPIYDKGMIKSFADKDTEDLFNGERV